MAKTIAQMDESKADLSTKVKKAIDGIRKPFVAFAKDFAALAMSREELAPKFMKAFGLWQAETAGTFVDFVRILDNTIGKQRADYRSHRTYQAADYLRRLAGQQARGGRRAMTAVERENVPATPTEAIARLLASIMPILGDDQQATLWQAVHAELHWSDRQVNRLQNQVEHVDPLVIVRPPRGQQVPDLRLTFPVAVSEPQSKAA